MRLKDLHTDSLPETIRQHRVIRGFSQEYVAHRLDISQRAYSKLERGETKMTVERLVVLCGVLGMDIQAIFSTF